MPKDATSVEYNKTSKMIKLTSDSSVDQLAKFFLSELTEKGWDEAQNPMVTDDTAIIKLSYGNASLTIFVHKHEDGSDATVVCKGVAWDTVPPSKVAAKRPAKKRPQEPAADSPLANTPDKSSDDEYRFDVAFDAKLANGGSAPAGDASDPATDELGAEEHDGLPYPLITTNRSSSGSKYRKSATASVPAALAAVIDFYRRELTARGWKENTSATKVSADTAALDFAGPEGSVLVRLSKEGDGTSANLAVRYPAKAKAAGIVPQPNRARLILGNASEREAVIVINGQQYKLPAGRGAKDPKDGVSLHVLPGKYTFVFKIPGQPDKTEELKVALDETWGSIILPTGGYFVDQVY